MVHLAAPARAYRAYHPSQCPLPLFPSALAGLDLSLLRLPLCRPASLRDSSLPGAGRLSRLAVLHIPHHALPTGLVPAGTVRHLGPAVLHAHRGRRQVHSLWLASSSYSLRLEQLPATVASSQLGAAVALVLAAARATCKKCPPLHSTLWEAVCTIRLKSRALPISSASTNSPLRLGHPLRLARLLLQCVRCSVCTLPAAPLPRLRTRRFCSQSRHCSCTLLPPLLGCCSHTALQHRQVALIMRAIASSGASST